MKLSERETAALLALAEMGGPAGGYSLAAMMRAAGRRTSSAAAHQAANGLTRKGLATKGHRDQDGHIRYEITARGRELAAGGAQ